MSKYSLSRIIISLFQEVLPGATMTSKFLDLILKKVRSFYTLNQNGTIYY